MIVPHRIVRLQPNRCLHSHTDIYMQRNDILSENWNYAHKKPINVCDIDSVGYGHVQNIYHLPTSAVFFLSFKQETHTQRERHIETRRFSFWFLLSRWVAPLFAPKFVHISFKTYPITFDDFLSVARRAYQLRLIGYYFVNIDYLVCPTPRLSFRLLSLFFCCCCFLLVLFCLLLFHQEISRGLFCLIWMFI